MNRATHTLSHVCEIDHPCISAVQDLSSVNDVSKAHCHICLCHIVISNQSYHSGCVAYIPLVSCVKYGMVKKQKSRVCTSSATDHPAPMAKETPTWIGCTPQYFHDHGDLESYL
ncbi:hypothetical protein NEOLEDRAFT_1143836 [Neolentinus lepideus HHB14362 ss-1]|uniref:Uncharacterized protein n=1 Tax=Neolentinus lepideus HHB14362 ss-1 TaxID=1314782 RepID=A0A165MB37_9AGAM|nr:hypothetical protein NEOLEDRAFT_1143836 [Neolentinus lepideus HHB14362 ss-1]